MARGAAIAWLFAMGCGRFGFEDVPQDDAPTGDAGDAIDMMEEPIRTCPATRMPGVDLAPQAPVRGLAGTSTPGGYTLAFQRGDQTAVDGFLVMPDLSAASADSPIRSTPLAGFDEQYVNVVLQWDGDRVLAGMTTDEGIYFWKVFPELMGEFTSAVQEPTATPARPFLATSDATVDNGRYGASFRGFSLSLYELDPAGVPTGIYAEQGFGTDVLAAGIVPRDESTSIAVIEKRDLGLAGLEVGMGAWDEFVVDPAGSRPSIVGTATAVYVTYVRGGELVATAITSSNLAVGTVETLATNAPDRFESALVAEGHRVVWWDAAGFGISGYKNLDGVAGISGLPAGAPDAWTLVERQGDATVFAAYGADLYTIPICF